MTEMQTNSIPVAAGAHPVGMPRLLRAPSPDREARTFLRLFNLLSRRAIGSYSLSELRQLWRLVTLALGRRTPVASVVERAFDGPGGAIDLRVYTPQERKGLSPGFIWCHGGGFMVGGQDTAESICRNIARAAGRIAISVRYRLQVASWRKLGGCHTRVHQSAMWQCPCACP